MIRGTTPTHTFRHNIAAETIYKVRVIYAQDNVVILTKENEACTIEGDTIKVRLTQEETLKFNHKKFVQIQIRVLTLGGDALASKISIVEVDKLLESEVFE